MASIDSMTFDQPGGYNQGQTITLTVDYTPDVPGVVPTTFTATTTITNDAGQQTAASSADFIVNVNQPGGDTEATTDTGGRSWSQTSDSGTVTTFTAPA